MIVRLDMIYKVCYYVIYDMIVILHLCFKQAQPKMCHSPKVDDGVEFF